MNINHVLFFCFLSALCDGNSGLVDAETLTRTEGESIIVACHFSVFGRRKFLCKDECDKENILVETAGDSAQSGRYSILYKEGTFPVSSTVLYVSIAQLTKSDAGRYRCGLERRFFPDAHWEFDIRVTDAPKTEALNHPEQQQTEETTAAATAHSVKGRTLPLVVCVTAAVLFAVVVLLLYKGKTSLSTRGQSDDRNLEFPTYEKCAKCEDYTSLSVDEISGDEDRHYCNL
ncbi:uncharacterized protein LOC127376940 isoform X2 [Dicentrarchus labrax]|uniref:uncharacterized protein LOC127376940 isoform X2 n=1 Tax=Dicentrarchus labrax TaxID=13489 RepID=UPI0021F5ECDF|nr:uncharacterized protein LOC127376940 isoform X2 [Dicentrarchus labrax]